MRVVDNVGFKVKKQEIPGGGNSGGNAQPLATPDWNQNDETAADYIKNRPFYDESLVSVPYPGEASFKWYKVSDQVPTGGMPNNGDVCTLFLDGNATELTVRLFGDDCYTCAESLVIVAFQDNSVMNNILLPEKGTYFLKTPDQYPTGFALGKATEPEITWDGNTGTIKQIDEKYIPEMNSLTLLSSTANSSKRFKITVDDSGTLTATEVTG